MNAERIVRRTRPSRSAVGKTDFKRLDAMTDREIEEAVAADPDASPIMSAKFWRDALIGLPGPKVPISLRADRNVLRWFKAHGRGYQTLINEVLRTYMFDHLATDRAATAESNRRAREEIAKLEGRAPRNGHARNGKPSPAKGLHAPHSHL